MSENGDATKMTILMGDTDDEQLDLGAPYSQTNPYLYVNIYIYVYTPSLVPNQKQIQLLYVIIHPHELECLLLVPLLNHHAMVASWQNYA